MAEIKRGGTDCDEYEKAGRQKANLPHRTKARGFRSHDSLSVTFVNPAGSAGWQDEAGVPFF
ncbi:hypothetical protein GCM10022626_26580 [[Pseudomonas] carboxydohydrogena]